MQLLATTLLALAALSAVASASILKVEDGVYKRLTVRISEDVPRQHCHRAIHNLKVLLTSTSRQLWTATDGLGSFGDAVVVLPASWRGTECVDGERVNATASALPEHMPDADFVVSGARPTSRPWSRQYSGECGAPARTNGVNLNFQLLTDAQNITLDTERRTFLEWARYRYGVYPEHGFDGDALYPAVYTVGPEERSNAGCVSATSNSTEIDDVTETNNGFELRDGSELQQLKPADHMASPKKPLELEVALCPVEGYDSGAPTKQNLLCSGRSALEVILDSDDFSYAKKPSTPVSSPQSKHLGSNFTDRIRNPESFDVRHGEGEGAAMRVQSRFEAPNFRFVLPAQRPRFVLALDISQAMAAPPAAWESIRNALFRFFSHVPDGAEVGIVTFGAKARVVIEPTVVNGGNRAGLFGKIPFRLLPEQTGCVECGLKIALKLLEVSGGANGGSVILISGTNKDSASLEDVRRQVVDDAVPVYNVAINRLSDDVLVLAKYGANYAVSTDEESDGMLLQKLGDIFLAIFNRNAPADKAIVKTHEKKYVWNSSSEAILSGNFVVEEGLNSNLWIILTSNYKEDVEIFEVTTPSGMTHVFPKYENGLVYFSRAGSNEVGIWSYRVKLYSFVQSGSSLTVEVVAEATSGGQYEGASADVVSLSSWTNVDTASALEDTVVIYASLMQGALPIRGASVIASVNRPGSSTPAQVVLRDDGTGYPDITKGDGIYSAYFVDFTSEAGLYSINVKATHDSGKATLPKPSKDDEADDCCGSAVASVDGSLPTRSFELHVTSPSLRVTSGVQFFMREGAPAMSDVFAPSRVSDLTVTSYVNRSLYAVLSWSAPGGDLDRGSASSYQIRCYTNREALSEVNFETTGIPVHESLLPKPAEFGQRQTATVGLPWANEIFYYGLVAIDESGNRSPVSNLVPVFAAEASEASAGEGDDEDGQSGNGLSAFDRALSTSASSVLEALRQDSTVYVIAGVVSGSIFIIILVISISVYRSRKRAAAKRTLKNQRTQIFVNDIENMPDLSSEKPSSGGYGGVWTTASALTSDVDLTCGQSPSSEYSHHHDLYTPHDPMMDLYRAGRHPASDQASWAYMTGAVPVHEYRSTSAVSAVAPVVVANGYGSASSCGGSTSGSTSNSQKTISAGTAAAAASSSVTVAPTYQNWTKPPSDNGTATTSSTECSTYDSDLPEKQRRRPSHEDELLEYANGQSNYVYASMDPASLSLSPSFVLEKRRRQESLV